MDSKTNTKLEIFAGHDVKFRVAEFLDNRISITLASHDANHLLRVLGFVEPVEQSVSATLTDEEGIESVPARLIFWEGTENDRGVEYPVLCAKLVLEFADAVRFDRGKRFLRRYSRENDLAYRDPDQPDDRILTSAERKALEPHESLAVLIAELAGANTATITFHGYVERGLGSEPYVVQNLSITPDLLEAARSPWKVEKHDDFSGSAARWIRIVIGTSREVRLIQSKLLMWFDRDCFMLPLDNDALQQMLIERCAG